VSDPTLIVRFLGRVSCRRNDVGPLGLALVGRTADYPDEVATLMFAAEPPIVIPETLEDIAVERRDANHFRVWNDQREWIVAASTHHLHREAATRFYREVAPRKVPWSKRLFWRLALGLAASSTGKRLLLALRARK
jgi:hypothetical protein